MTNEQLWCAFSSIVEDCISNPAIQHNILSDVTAHLQTNANFPAKSVLATINKHSDRPASQASAKLIKEIVFHYG